MTQKSPRNSEKMQKNAIMRVDKNFLRNLVFSQNWISNILHHNSGPTAPTGTVRTKKHSSRYQLSEELPDFEIG